MTKIILFTLASLILGQMTYASKTALLIAGEPSHAAGEHEFVENTKLLADTLNSTDLPIRAIAVEGFPSEEQIAEADTIFIFSDGLGRHVARGHLSKLEAHTARGKGLGIIHFALEPSSSEMGALFDRVLGGYFVVNHSVNPIWTLEEPILSDHPINRGVTLGPVEDEWYYHMRFVNEVEPVLQGHPPADTLGASDGPRSGNPSVRAALDANEAQILAWARVSDSGTRAFAFTGGHWHFNFGDEHYRRLLLNAIVWTAGIEVPEQGVSFEVIPIPRYDHIFIAIVRGDIADVRRHLELNPESVNIGRNPSQPPLHVSMLRQQDAITKLLVENGADLNMQDGSGRSPVHIAGGRGEPELIEFLINEGADPNLRCSRGWTPLHHAAAQNKIEVVKQLLKSGADATKRSELGGTPLHEAASTGSPEIAQILIDAGSDPAVVSKTGKTALHIAVEFENEGVMQLLRGLAE